MSNVEIKYNKMAYLFDGTLSLKAKGLMAMAVAYINKNQPSIFNLYDLRPFYVDGNVAFTNALKELERAGYVEKSLGRDAFQDNKSPWTYVLKE